MSRAIRPQKGRRLVLWAALGAIVLVGGGTTAAVALSWSPDPPDNLCRVATNDTYKARVDSLLADYDGILQDWNDLLSDPATDASSFGFTALFKMQACHINEWDLPHGWLRRVIYDPQFRGDEPAAPIDIEVAWFSELGVEGLFAGWSTIARLDHGLYGLPDVQRLLSLGLAHATNPDRDAVLESGVYPDDLADKDRHLGFHYTREFIDLGDQSVGVARYKGLELEWGPTFGGDYLKDDPDDWELADAGPRVHGWMVLAPLLRFGDFHEQFLAPVATAIIEFDRARNGDWVIECEEPVSFDVFDHDRTDAMDAVLEALARNPAAAEAVFDATGDLRVMGLNDR